MTLPFESCMRDATANAELPPPAGSTASRKCVRSAERAADHGS